MLAEKRTNDKKGHRHRSHHKELAVTPTKGHRQKPIKDKPNHPPAKMLSTTHAFYPKKDSLFSPQMEKQWKAATREKSVSRGGVATSALPPKFDVEGLFPSIQGIKKDEAGQKGHKGAPADANKRTHSMKIEKNSRQKV